MDDTRWQALLRIYEVTFTRVLVDFLKRQHGLISVSRVDDGKNEVDIKLNDFERYLKITVKVEWINGE